MKRKSVKADWHKALPSVSIKSQPTPLPKFSLGHGSPSDDVRNWRCDPHGHVGLRPAALMAAE